MLSYSHPSRYSNSFKVRDHAIVWGFTDIFLPPKSLAGDKMSSGFIQFKAGLVDDLKIGDSISNQAHIYFDFQDPVHTNIALTEVTEPAQPIYRGNSNGLSFEIYPNPNQGEFNVNFSPYLIQEIEIFNLKGQKVFNKSLQKFASSSTVNTDFLVSGIYTVRLIHTLGVATGKLVITK
ncbi:MAG: T9SS type A sorting domain-containing protein [Bacteroidia bacterium]